ncbi:ubiquitin-like small modifier protein 1 [Hyperthermus butylicus]|uniref:Molybdopterin converting factor, small subunit n=1 Tax=Hyperthermus butylicus (strain DSM 5456 / JCM 9403 / PLM1-5) TaxID=415426 RepID=A2BJ47_HYPBU|nr:ubiquitin-like small modifier protein 1 [Hyperthermus butylicus]ABM80008.1 Molybdopterin converting factor, small subunit [Hyperthermus butylicus DSM 5456]
MKITVRLYAGFHEAVGSTELELEVPKGVTVLDVARILEEKFPGLRGRLVKDGELQDDVLVLVNGRSIEWLEGVKTKLRSGDRVAFFPPAAGG